MAPARRFCPRLERLEAREQPSTVFLGTLGQSHVVVQAQVTETGTFFQQITPSGHTRDVSIVPASPHAQYYESPPYQEFQRDLVQAGLNVQSGQPQLAMALRVVSVAPPTAG
jgi:hypothetical protein